MSVRVVVDMYLKPEAVGPMKAGMRAMLPETREFEGCEEVLLHEDQDDPNHFMIIERWASRDRYQAYLDWRSQRGEMSTDPFTAPMRFTFLDLVDV
jgi:quinol monooxygenase YgiN